MLCSIISYHIVLYYVGIVLSRGQAREGAEPRPLAAGDEGGLFGPSKTRLNEPAIRRNSSRARRSRPSLTFSSKFLDSKPQITSLDTFKISWISLGAPVYQMSGVRVGAPSSINRWIWTRSRPFFVAAVAVVRAATARRRARVKYVYVYMYIYIYIYIYFSCLSLSLYMCIYIYNNTCIHIYIYIYIYIQLIIVLLLCLLVFILNIIININHRRR